MNTSAQTAHKHALVWFTQDLRIHDNPTLQHAHAQSDHVLHVVFIKDLLRPLAFAELGAPSKKRAVFLYQALASLEQSLAQHGHQLLIFNGHAKHVLPQLIERYPIDAIFRSQLSGYDEYVHWANLKVAYPRIAFTKTSSVSLFTQDQLPFELYELHKHFTPFRQAIEKANLIPRSALAAENDTTTLAQSESPHVDELINDANAHGAHIRLAEPAAVHSSSFDIHAALDELSQTIIPITGGESAALAHVSSYFNSEAPASYKQTRNALQCLTDTSRNSTCFSPYLAQGSLSVGQLWRTLNAYETHVTANESTYWIYFELLWREFFFWNAKKLGTALFKKRGIKASAPLTSFYPERFRAWCAGQTPWPIVNACMKQLTETGFMSNRGRQIVASCLIHELGIDWRYGATFFEQHLLDYDVGSNWGNWQYQAGVGADPRGSRRFDLEKQTAQFDPEHTFIKRWDATQSYPLPDSQDPTGWPIF